MKIVNYKLRITFWVATLPIIILFIPVMVFAAIDTGGLIPCSGVDCSLCDVFALIQRIFTFIVTVFVPIIGGGLVAWGGFTMLISGGNTDKVKAGRKILTNTVVGIVIIYTSYVLASYVVGFFAGSTGNATKSFQGGTFVLSCDSGSVVDKTGDLSSGKLNLNLKPEELVPIAGDADSESPLAEVGTDPVNTGLVENVVVASGVNITDLNRPVYRKLQEASWDPVLKTAGIKLLVTSGVRTLDKQKDLVEQNCPSGLDTKKSSDCRPETCIPNDTGSNCKHVGSTAVDVLGSQNNAQCSGSSECQQTVIDVMKSKGFCRLDSERWHFELKSLIADNRKAVFECP